MQARPRVLIIDDDPMFRSVVVALLRKDYLVSVANDGKEGYDKAKKHKPDIAIIDIQMPGWGGLQTLQAFRENPSLSDVKIIMLTGDNSKATVIAAIKSGANDYVIKETFRKSDFLDKVQRQLPFVSVAPPANKSAAPASQQKPVASAVTSASASSGGVAIDDNTDPEIDAIMDDWD